MRTTDTSRLRGRRGTSTIFGTLIFIAILFSSVVPMYLYMRQADAIFEKRKHELNRLDEEREGENIHVYVFNKTTSPESLTLRVENWGDLVVDIERIWINDTCYPLDDFNVQPENWLEEELTGFTPVTDTRYFIKVATDRGNVFSTESGSLYCDESGNWETGMFTIYFFISYPASGWYDIDITYSGNPVPESPLHIHKSAHETAYNFHDVPTEGTYHVKITKREAEVIYNDDVIIPWPNGPTSVNVRA